MKTAKATTVHGTKEWTGDKGTFYYCNVTLDNGDEINIGKKAPIKEGDELTYELTGGDDGQQRFKKAKAVQPQQQGGGGGFKGQPKDQDAILYQTCLKCATEIHAGKSMQMPTAEELSAYAFRLAGIAKVNIVLLKGNG